MAWWHHTLDIAGLLWGKTACRWPDESPQKGPVMWSFCWFALLNKWWTFWWRETPWGSCAVTVICWQPHDSTHSHDDVIKWRHFPRCWPFVRGIHRSPVNSLHKGQWRGTLMFSLICVWINGWVNNRDAWWFETPWRPLWRHCNMLVESTITTTRLYTFWPVHISPDVLETSDVILCH